MSTTYAYSPVAPLISKSTKNNNNNNTKQTVTPPGIFDIRLKPTPSLSILCDYVPIVLSSSQIERNLGTVSFPVVVPKATSQLIKMPEGITYRTQRAWITPPQHQLKYIDYNGEIILEHVPWTNNSGKLYLCFLLQTDTSLRHPTMLDSLIQPLTSSEPTSITLDFASLISSDTNPGCIVYRDGINTVVIYIQTIRVQSKFQVVQNSLLFVPSLFTLFQSNYHIGRLTTDNNNRTTLAVVEGLDGGGGPGYGYAQQQQQQQAKYQAEVAQSQHNLGLALNTTTNSSSGTTNTGAATANNNNNPLDVVAGGGSATTYTDDSEYVQCQPVSASESEVQTMIVPLQSSALYDVSMNNTIAFSIYLCYFLLMVGATYACLPFLYRQVLLPAVGPSRDSKVLIQQLSVLIRVFFFFVGFVFISTGNATLIPFGLFMFTLIGIYTLVHCMHPEIVAMMTPSGNQSMNTSAVDVGAFGYIMNNAFRVMILFWLPILVVFVIVISIILMTVSHVSIVGNKYMCIASGIMAFFVLVLLGAYLVSTRMNNRIVS